MSLRPFALFQNFDFMTFHTQLSNKFSNCLRYKVWKQKRWTKRNVTDEWNEVSFIDTSEVVVIWI